MTSPFVPYGGAVMAAPVAFVSPTAPYDVALDLNLAVKALIAKQLRITALMSYYDGHQPMMYSHERLREIFRNLSSFDFNENWCGVVIDATADRILLTGMQIGQDVDTPSDTQSGVDAGKAMPDAQDAFDALWDTLDLSLEADTIHTYALVAGESYLIIWTDPQTPDAGIDAYYNDPRMVQMFYETENPRKTRFAAKWWTGDDDKRRITLYYPDRLYYYIAHGNADTITDARSFVSDTPADMPNPYGIIPVFHFRPSSVNVDGDLTDVIPLQNAINKLLIDMLASAEYAASKQKWVIGSAGNLGKLRNGPNMIWEIPAGDGQGQPTSVGEFGHTDLKNFTDTIENQIMALSAITHTPKHYFVHQRGDPSGEALIAMEAPLIKKVNDRIARFMPTWRQVGAFLLQLMGFTVLPGDITPQFDDSATIQPLTEAQTLQIWTTAGVPLVTVLRRMGWTQQDIDQMKADQQEADARSQALTPAPPASTGNTPAISAQMAGTEANPSTKPPQYA